MRSLRVSLTLADATLSQGLATGMPAKCPSRPCKLAFSIPTTVIRGCWQPATETRCRFCRSLVRLGRATPVDEFGDFAAAVLQGSGLDIPHSLTVYGGSRGCRQIAAAGTVVGVGAGGPCSKGLTRITQDRMAGHCRSASFSSPPSELRGLQIVPRSQGPRGPQKPGCRFQVPFAS